MRVLDERREALVEREIDLCPRGRAEDISLNVTPYHGTRNPL